MENRFFRAGKWKMPVLKAGKWKQCPLLSPSTYISVNIPTIYPPHPRNNQDIKSSITQFLIMEYNFRKEIHLKWRHVIYVDV